MPFPVTPSPFRLSRQPRRSAGPQFANSPRFLLSQGASQKSGDEVDIVDDDDVPSSTAPVARTPAPRTTKPRRQKDAIEDSDDPELPRTASRRANANELIEDSIDSSPSRDLGTPAPVDDEFDALFAPVQKSNKRQRLSAARPSLEDKLRQESEETEPLSLGPQIETKDIPQSPASARAPGPPAQATPMPPPRPIPFGVATPTSNTPFRSKPRFMLSAKKLPNSQSTQPSRRPDIPVPQSASPERRKPTFVLPRSPSPGPADEDIPAPFSPSARTLNRRGRPRVGVSVYTPGGMAGEVRSWILEMGAKREETALIPTSTGEKDPSRYQLVARVVNSRHAGVTSSGPLTFIEGQTQDEARKPAYIMAMGTSRSGTSIPSSRASTTQLQAGDLIGVYRGLTWEVDLPTFQPLRTDLESSENDSSTIPRRKWLVAMEWDLV